MNLNVHKYASNGTTSKAKAVETVGCGIALTLKNICGNQFHVISSLLIIAFTVISISAHAADDFEKVDLYLGHFLLQSWPGGKRTINVEVNPDFPADTLTFKASGFKTGLTQTTLDIQNMSGVTIEQIHRQNPKADAGVATFIYVLNKEHLDKLKDSKFKVVLDNHQYTTPEIHNVAIINITRPR